MKKARSDGRRVGPRRPGSVHSLVIAVTSRALFGLEESHAIFRRRGLRAYDRHQVAHENETLRKGVAFPLVSRLLRLRAPGADSWSVKVVLVSKNNPSTGLRAFNSIEKYNLRIRTGAFTGGAANHAYLRAFGVHLFLSADRRDVQLALGNGIPAASIYVDQHPPARHLEYANEIRFAFDGDSVLFSDEADKVFQEKGLKAYLRNEARKHRIPLGAGPFKPLLDRLCSIQRKYGEGRNPIRIALVTARSAPAHKRAIHTLRRWGIKVDEAFFLGGMNKAPVLQGFRPHIYFEDQETYALPASDKVPTGLVPTLG